jgi:hypothetical protein
MTMATHHTIPLPDRRCVLSIRTTTGPDRHEVAIVAPGGALIDDEVLRDWPHGTYDPEDHLLAGLDDAQLAEIQRALGAVETTPVDTAEREAVTALLAEESREELLALAAVMAWVVTARVGPGFWPSPPTGHCQLSDGQRSVVVADMGGEVHVAGVRVRDADVLERFARHLLGRAESLRAYWAEHPAERR